ncbi:MAG: hypothetical protein RL758_138 [Pseudomonadota bacterium]|jgi:hypothetical protein
MEYVVAFAIGAIAGAVAFWWLNGRKPAAHGEVASIQGGGGPGSTDD